MGRTIQSSVEMVLHLIDWIQTRNDFYVAHSSNEWQKLANQLEIIALEVLPLLESDSRLGYAAVGNGGLFTPALVRWKIGELDDVQLRQLPEELAQLNGKQ